MIIGTLVITTVVSSWSLAHVGRGRDAATGPRRDWEDD